MAALMRMSRLANAGSFRYLFQCNRTICSSLSVARTSLVRNEIKQIFPQRLCVRPVSSVTESVLQDSGTDLHSGGQTGRRAELVPVSLDTRVINLEGQLRRLSRADRGQLYRILSQAENGDGLSDQQALTLIRAAGAPLAKETAARRQQIFSQIWNRLQKMGVQFNISHHNAALKSRMENGEKINPDEVLSDLENKLRLFPNRITYQLLIGVYCNHGDLGGATAILEHMKSQDIPINEAVFQALIMGHMKKGDPAGAREVVTSMRSSGLLPNTDTYTALLCGYAQLGDLEGFNAVLAETESEEVSLQSRHLFEAIISAVVNGHSALLQKMLKEVHDVYGTRPPYNQEALNCAFRLSAQDHQQEAMTVFRRISDFPSEEYKETIALYFLDTLMLQGKPLSEILGAQEELVTAGYLVTPNYRPLVTAAVRCGDTQKAMELLNMMAAKGEELSRQDYQPVLRASRPSQNPDLAYSLASQMAAHVQDNITTNDIFFQVVEPLIKRNVAAEEIFDKLKEHGMTDRSLGHLKVLYSLYTGEYSQAKEDVTAQGLPGLSGITVLLAQGFHQTKNVQGLVDFLQYLRMHVVSAKYYDDLTAMALSRAIGRKEVSLSEAEDLIAAYNEKELVMQHQGAIDEVRKYLRVKDISADRLQEIMQSFKSEPSSSYIGSVRDTEVTEKNMSSLKTQYEANPDSLPASMRNKAEILLLKAYCRDGNMEMADKVKARLDDRGFLYRVDLLLTLANYYARYKKDITTALQYKSQILEERTSLPARLHLNLATLYAEQGNFDKAMEEIREAKNIEGKFKYELAGVVDGFLSLIPDPAQRQEAVETLFNMGYVQRGTLSVLGKVMEAFLERGDIDPLIAAMRHMVTEYNKAPLYNQILKFFIDREDAQHLQEVVDLMSATQGEMEVLHHLAFCFVECGKVRQAQKILQTPRLRAQHAVLDTGFRRLYNADQLEHIMTMVDITRDLAGVSRDDLLFWLMRLHARRGEYQKALDVLTRYEEEMTNPRPRTLRYLAKVLQSQDIPVPFTVPEAKQRQQPERVTDEMQDQRSETPAAKDILRLIAEEEVDKALQLKLSTEEGGEHLRPDLMATAAVNLFVNKRVNTLMTLVERLADSGDIESLNHIRPRLRTQRVSNMLGKQLFRAYVNSDRTVEFLDFLQGNLTSVPVHLSTANIQHLADIKPDLLPKLVSLIKTYTELAGSRQSVANFLYNYYLLSDQTQEAEALLQKYPAMKLEIHARFLLRNTDEKQMDNMCATLLDVTQGERKSYLVYSKWLSHKCEGGDIEGARSLYQQGLDSGMQLRNFSLRTLDQYQNLLQTHGHSVPWEPEDLDEIRRELESRRRKPSGKDGVDSSPIDSDTDSSKTSVKL